MLSFASTSNPFFLTPTYRQINADGVASRLRNLNDPTVRERILAEHGAYKPEGFAGLMTGGFNRMFRMNNPVDYEPAPDASIAAEAARTNKSPAEHCYDVMLEEGGRRILYMPLINYARGDLNDVYGMMQGAHTLYGLSDGGAHCGTISDASFPTTTISLWSRGDKRGQKFPLEALVHGYSQRNARHVGWFDRGVVAPGYVGDLNVIDMQTLSLAPPEIVQDLPAGGTRLLQRPQGYRWTIKSGEATFENGEWTGATPGGLLRGQQRL
jgi:N-acyl-D-aspartate/D-glutamate deacylase